MEKCKKEKNGANTMSNEYEISMYEKYIKKEIVNHFLNCLESMFLVTEGERKSRSYYCHYYP